jgi:hypothetical protein
MSKPGSSATTSPTHLSPQTSPRASTSSPPKQLQALALYDFKANEPSELSFGKGDVLTLLIAKVGPLIASACINAVQGSWWIAELKGHKGEIPGNYVQLLT